MYDRRYCVYILTNDRNTVLYTGVTGDMSKRLAGHRAGTVSSFTKRYNVKKLVYVRVFDDPETAIAEEKRIKGGPRRRKIALIEAMNPGWEDLTHLL